MFGIKFRANPETTKSKKFDDAGNWLDRPTWKERFNEEVFGK